MSVLSKVLKFKQDYETAKKTLAGAGNDISGVKYITDLPGVLAKHLPADMAAAAADIIGDKDRVKALLEAFGCAASVGGLVDAIYEPGDKVKDGDLHA